jgi:nucleotide-binding universal stress UspA family protein
MYHSILVPLDGSPLSEYALPIACDIARRSGAELHLVHVHVRATPAPIYVEGMPVVDEQLQSLSKEHELAYLESIRDRLTAEPELPMTVAVLDPFDADLRDQTVPDMLASYAATANSDLIVMTTHGRGGLERFWLGSVADALVRASTVPVLLVRPDEHHPTAQPPLFRQTLIPLDGSALAEQILESALMLGAPVEAEYTLLHVVQPHVLVRWGPFTTPTDLDSEATQRRQLDAQHYLERVARALRATGKQVVIRVVVAEQAAPAILEEARQHGIDLIAIATHGRRSLGRLLLGSVADKVLRRTDIPLLLYRPTFPPDSAGRQSASAMEETPRDRV